VPERATPSHPFTLLTGRASSAQWHTQTRTGKSQVLARLSPCRIYVELNPGDALRIGVRSGDRVDVASRRGRLRAVAFVTPCIRPAQVFIPMHFEETNRLTHASFDPYSRQPAYKACAVSVEPAPL
jgi:assimilatory nitrate reductase catalytic subunit